MRYVFLAGLLSVCVPCAVTAAADDIVIADFEAPNYGDWVATGEAFGPGPASGALPNQMAVSGYLGKTPGEFVLQRRWHHRQR